MNDWAHFLLVAMLVMVRVSGLLVFAPVFSSAAIAPRIKAGFVFAVTLLLAPVVNSLGQNHHIVQLNVASLLGELGVGLVFGLSLSLLSESLLFAATLLGMEFSFSLVNLMDPNSMVETQVLGQLLNWIGILVLIGAGLDRTLLAAVMRSFASAPVGQAVITVRTGAAIASMAAGIFLAGLQLAAPVMAATLAVEIAIALIGRISPQLPVQFISVPLKTLIAYVVMIATLALWPAWIEHHFTALLDAAGRLVAG